MRWLLSLSLIVLASCLKPEPALVAPEMPEPMVDFSDSEAEPPVEPEPAETPPEPEPPTEVTPEPEPVPPPEPEEASCDLDVRATWKDPAPGDKPGDPCCAPTERDSCTGRDVKGKFPKRSQTGKSLVCVEQAWTVQDDFCADACERKGAQILGCYWDTKRGGPPICACK